MPPRIPLIEHRQAPPSAAPLFEGGDPGPLVAAWAHVPELLDVALPFIGMVLGPSSIGIRAKELVILRTSALMACRYCVDAHTDVALDVGLDPTEVAALRDERPIDESFTAPNELALLKWTDAVAIGPGIVPDTVAEDMARHWQDYEIVELTMLVGVTLMLNRFATSLQLPTSDQTMDRLRTLGFPSTADSPLRIVPDTEPVNESDAP